jgi:CHAT domain-containing protein
MDRDTVLFSFHLGRKEAWAWAVERDRATVVSLGDSGAIRRRVSDLVKAQRAGMAAFTESRALYRTLFGAFPETYRNRKRWLLELDSDLFELPFGALVLEDGARPVLLIQKAALQIVPGALLLRRGRVSAQGRFIGIGDPVYNAADPRYRGVHRTADLTLPRLPNTSVELEACARQWGRERSSLLTGMAATERSMWEATANDAAILHFATHVVSSPERREGLIALALDSVGAMGLIGTKEILARPAPADLVVMNGCHSGQSEALPGSGLLGLTRAWIGAGAGAVLATQWDVPDTQARSFMVTFYRALRTTANLDPADALREAQLQSLGLNGDNAVQNWAGYFLISRLI